jgi:acyl-CoA thioesterase I
MKRSDIRVCFVGDSLTVGVGDRHWAAWPQRACASQQRLGLDLTPYNLGVRGNTSVEVLRRWRAECSRRLVDPFIGGIVFAFGLNDTCVRNGRPRVRIEDSIANAAAAIAAASEWKSTLWIGPTPVDRRRDPWCVTTAGVEHRFNNASIAALNDQFRQLAGELRTPFVDVFTRFEHSPEWADALAGGDGVHPSDDGHRLIAECVVDSPAWREWLRGMVALVAA